MSSFSYLLICKVALKHAQCLRLLKFPDVRAEGSHGEGHWGKEIVCVWEQDHFLFGLYEAGSPAEADLSEPPHPSTFEAAPLIKL